MRMRSTDCIAYLREIQRLSEMGIYKRKRESKKKEITLSTKKVTKKTITVKKKERIHALDQEKKRKQELD